MSKASRAAHEAGRHAHQGVEGLARMGYAAKGFTYMLVGILAIQVAAGVGGKTTDPKGALTTLTDEPFGQLLLGLIALGFLGFAIWREVQALRDTEHKGDDAKGIARRVGYAGSGLIYGGLALWAGSLALPGTIQGGGGGGGGTSTQGFTAWLMSMPAGQVLVGLVGVGVIGFGLYQLYRGVSKKFMDKLKTGEMSAKEHRLTERVGQIGLAAIAVVFAIIGGFLIQAAWQAQPQEAGGLAEALATLAAQPFGTLLLGVVAAGLIAYGVYMLMVARYRRIQPA